MSFMEGFSKSLGSYFLNKAQQDEDLKRSRDEWEFRENKIREWEAATRKSKVARTEVTQEGGQWVVRKYNEDGEQLGDARLATAGEIKEQEEAAENRKLSVRKAELDVSNAERQGKLDQDKLDNLGVERERASRESEARIAASQGSAAYQAALLKEKQLEQEFFDKNNYWPTRGPAVTERPQKELSLRERESLLEEADHAGIDPDEVKARMNRAGETYSSISQWIINTAAAKSGSDKLETLKGNPSGSIADSFLNTTR